MNIVIPKPVNEVLNIINEHGYEAYIIGGAVRNWVMDAKPTNYDISTNASLEEIKKILKGYNTFYTGENDSRLGIVNSKFPMEISKYRTKENTLEADLATRDFTMNALAYSDEDGLIDFSSGVVDINNKVIKINGEDDRIFVEDPLRIIRAIRLSAEYAMRIDPETQEYMFENKELVENVAPERIRDELSKLLVTPRAEFYLKKYLEIFLEIIPELSLLENYNQNDPHHIYDALNHTFASMKAIEPDLDLRLTMLFHDIAKPFTYSKDEKGVAHYKDHAQKGAEMARAILNRLKFNKKTIQRVTKLIEYHDYEFTDNDVRIKQFLQKFGTDDVDALFAVKRANYYAKNPAYVSELTKIDEDYARVKAACRKTSFVKKNELKITGKDLLELGVPQENVGKVLDEIYELIINGKLKNNREKMIDYTINQILPKGYDDSEIVSLKKE
jgi:tRNA nucleotidyltransferase (CCA-adding enzyme)